jgi:hypothetical protein
MSGPKGVTDDQLIAERNKQTSWRGVALALGLNRRSVERRVAGLALKGYSPQHDMTHSVPDGYKVKGVSTLYREDGTVAAQWVKSSADAEHQRAMLEAAFAGMADELPRVKRTPPPKNCSSDKLSCYVITDYHLGMLAWSEETRGEPWDLAISEKLLVDWFAAAIAQAPDSETAVFAQLGDFCHFDGLDAVTPEHRNLLDADTRFQKVVRSAIRVLRTVIEMLLEKHKRVQVIMAEGNHDPASSVWLREWFSAIYENEPRVIVDTSPDPYYCIEHGSTSLFFHHGHKRNPGNVADVFAAKFRDVFGRTKYSYAHMGHRHHVDLKETNLMIVEQHRTLASNDAYASRGGWLSGRDAKVITYSKRFGEVGRVILSPDAVRDAA